MAKYYILEGTQPIESTLLAMNHWFKKNKTEVQYTVLGSVTIRTSFIGINHAFGLEPPKVFETKVEGLDQHHPTQHWPTWEQAERGHKKIVNEIENLSTLKEK